MARFCLSYARLWLGGLLTYAWVICLPLVGRAGASTPHAAKNFAASLVLLVGATALTSSSAWRPGTAHGWRALAVAQCICLILLVSGALRA